MAGESIRVVGLAKFIRATRDIDPAVKDEVKALNRWGAEQVVPVAQGLVPRRDGDLAGSIRAGATQRSGVVRAGKAAVPYAGPIHFGWPARNIRPQPFLWDALDQRRDAIFREYEQRLNRVVDRVFSAGAATSQVLS